MNPPISICLFHGPLIVDAYHYMVPAYLLGSWVKQTWKTGITIITKRAIDPADNFYFDLGEVYKSSKLDSRLFQVSSPDRP